MADLSWTKDAPRRLAAGTGLLVAICVSLLLWALIVGLALVL